MLAHVENWVFCCWQMQRKKGLVWLHRWLKRAMDFVVLLRSFKICTPRPCTFCRPCRLERQNPWPLSVNGVATQALSFFASANGRKPNFPHVHQYHERTWNGSDQKRWFWFPFCVSYIAPVKRSFTASQCSAAWVQSVWCSLGAAQCIVVQWQRGNFP